MNPLTSVKGTIISGFILAILVALYVSPDSSVFQTRNFSIWLHALFGVTWVGLLQRQLVNMLLQERFYGSVWPPLLHGLQGRGLFLSLRSMVLHKLFFFRRQLDL